MCVQWFLCVIHVFGWHSVFLLNEKRERERVVEKSFLFLSIQDLALSVNQSCLRFYYWNY